jgi:hypothetical protein
MNYKTLLFGLVFCVSLTSCDFVPSSSPSDPVAVPFEVLQGDVQLFGTPDGYYVFRDSARWSQTTEEWWGEVFTCGENGCHKVPPPQFSFTDSLIIAVSYGMVGCSQKGGGVDQIEEYIDSVKVKLKGRVGRNPACAEVRPLHHYVRVAKKYLPEEKPIGFVQEHAASSSEE